MLGPIGPFLSAILRKKYDFTIYRNSPIELKYSRSLWAHLLSRNPIRFGEVFVRNRETLKGVPTWASKETLARSHWRYGVGAEWDSQRGDVDDRQLNAIPQDITYSDVLAFLASFHDGLGYLEIGVSVGKNFAQLCNVLKNAEMYGIDVEDPNPALGDILGHPESVWESGESYEIDTLSGAKARKKSALYSISGNVNSNRVFYLSADQFREDTWAQLDGHTFNMVFSDGVHSGAALTREFEFLTKHRLISDDKFVMFWDDLWGVEMQRAFADNAAKLCGMFGCDESAIALYKLRGTYGEERPMGIFLSPGFARAIEA